MLAPCLKTGILEAGCDEAGRGCLAGPVAAAAVILPEGYQCEELDDSKVLTPEKRAQLAHMIEVEALSFGISFVWPQEIDEVNILNASFLAMHRALDQLKPSPQCILVDGNRFTPYRDIPHSCIVKGDGSYQSIAAASILAKHHRDQLMIKLHKSHPDYNWEQNKGYPTLEHRKAILKFGLSPEHRRSFKLLPNPNQLALFDL